MKTAIAIAICVISFIAPVRAATTQLNLTSFGPANGNPGLDGTGDWRNAIQAAINAAIRLKLRVYVPGGDYRIVATLPIEAHGFLGFDGDGARFWISLPSDYTNPNVYGVNNKYTTTGVLDSTGALVSFDSSNPADNPVAGYYYGVTPWNGKTVVFQDFSNDNGCIISGITFDGGWGTVGAPGSVIPVTGIRSDINENSFYALFANCSNTRWERCTFNNIPGAAITSGFGYNIVENCVFGEYGDHCFYQSNGQRHRFDNNQVLVQRAQVSVQGNAAYVPQTYRDAIKYRNMVDSSVRGNIFEDLNTSRLSQFMTLESNSSFGSPTNGSRNINISGNTVKTAVGIIGVAFRAPAVPDGSGLRNEHISIVNNTWNIQNNVMQFIDFACTNLLFADNVANLNNGILLQLYGNILYTNAVAGFTIQGNSWQGGTDNQSPILAGGNIHSLTIRNNKLTGTPINHLTRKALIDVKSEASAVRNSTPMRMDYLTIENNDAWNYYAWVTDDGFVDWVSGTTYSYSTFAADDGTFINNRVVRDTSDGLAYTNKATVTSATLPSADPANWGLYNIPDCNLRLIANDRFSETVAVGDCSRYLASMTGNQLKYRYKLNENDNRNYTTLAAPITYLFPYGLQAASVTYVTTNLYQHVNDVDVTWRQRIRGTNSILAALDVQSGTVKSSGANAPGFYPTLVSSIRPDVDFVNHANRELRVVTETDSGSFSQALYYNGYPSNTIASPTYYQGVFGKLLALKFLQTGQIDFYVQNGEFGAGAVTQVYPTNVFRLSSGVTTNDPPYAQVQGLLSVLGDVNVTGSFTVPTFFATLFNTGTLTTTNGFIVPSTNAVPADTNAVLWIPAVVGGVTGSIPFMANP